MDRLTDSELEIILATRVMTNVAFPASASGMMLLKALNELKERRAADAAALGPVVKLSPGWEDMTVPS